MVEAAEVIKIIKRDGPKGISLIKCKLVDGNRKILERAVIGKIKIGDFVYLKETEMEGVQ